MRAQIEHSGVCTCEIWPIVQCAENTSSKRGWDKSWPGWDLARAQDVVDGMKAAVSIGTAIVDKRSLMCWVQI